MVVKGSGGRERGRRSDFLFFIISIIYLFILDSFVIFGTIVVINYFLIFVCFI